MEGPIAMIGRTSSEISCGEARDLLDVRVSEMLASKWVLRAGNLWDHGSCTDVSFWQQVFSWQLWGVLWNKIYLDS